MRRIELTMKEERKFKIISNLINNDGCKALAARELNISIRHLNRLITLYKQNGKIAFAHASRGKTIPNSKGKLLKPIVIDLYKTKYESFNYLHFTEKLLELEGIEVSYAFVYNTLTEAFIMSPSIHRKTKRVITKLRVASENKTATPEVIDKKVDFELSLDEAHPRVKKSDRFLHSVQMDASSYRWFGDSKTTLHLAVDNCTGMVVGAFFDYEETLHGYYKILESILLNIGIPHGFLTDNRSTFAYSNEHSKRREITSMTKFSEACDNLGINLETTSIPQAKGQIERLNRTFQDRLTNELKLVANITNLEEANEFLLSYLPRYNKDHASQINYTTSAAGKKLSREAINKALSFKSSRVVDCGCSIRYNNGYYQVYKDDKLLIIKKNTKCNVIQYYDKTLAVEIYDEIYELRELVGYVRPKQEKVKKPPKYKGHKPSPNHPWYNKSGKQTSL
jgi:hypothetical protein